MREKCNTFFNKYRKIIFITLGSCILLFATLGINYHFLVQKQEYEIYNLTEHCSVSVNEKCIYEGNATTLELNHLKKGDIVKIGMILPINNIVNPIIHFYNENNKVNVFYEGKQVYSHGKIKKSKNINGYYNVKVPIENNCSNKRVDIELIINNDNIDIFIPEFRLINAFENDKIFVAENIYSIYIGIFMMIFGFISVILMFASFKENNSKVILMSTIFIMLSMWIFASLKILELYTKNYVLEYYIEHISLYLAAATLILYARESIITKKYKQILLYISLTIDLYTIVATTLQIFELGSYVELLRIFHIMLVIGAIITVIFFIKEKDYKKQNKMMKVSFYPIILVTMVYTIVSFIDNIMARSILAYIPIVVLMWLIINYVAYFFELSESFLCNTEKKYLMVMAYIDPLTGVSNRRAYEDKLKKVEEDKENNYTVICFDINNLKIVNDKYGHKEGDRLIKTFATSANEIFGTGKDFIGRTGGDEFISIVLGDNVENINEKLKLLRDNINDIVKDMDIEYKVAYSFGYHIYVQNEGTPFEDVIFKADEKMYENKVKMKKNDMDNKQ